MNPTYSTDIVIFGGGITGLWLLNRLRGEGYDPILFETNAIGGTQTIASQGIIHGGLKYALSGQITGAASTVADMPSRWRKCLQGKGEVDLIGVKILSNHYYMWSDGGLRSKLKSFLGSKTLAGKVQPLKKSEYPDFFKLATVNGSLYRLPDFVIDTYSLIEKLASDCNDRIFTINEDNLSFVDGEITGRKTLQIKFENKTLVLNAEKFIFCAGEGNARLIKLASLNSIASQIRPLHMVYLSKANLPELYAHCIGNSFSLTPKLTISSHQSRRGDSIWYLGGGIAESGTQRSQDEQITFTRIMLEELFPWMDFSTANWSSFPINRAEAKIENGYRPNDAFVANENNILVTWPTKLTLTPSLADKVVDDVKSRSIEISQNVECRKELQVLLRKPEMIQAFWD